MEKTSLSLLYVALARNPHQRVPTRAATIATSHIPPSRPKERAPPHRQARTHPRAKRFKTPQATLACMQVRGIAAASTRFKTQSTSNNDFLLSCHQTSVVSVVDHSLQQNFPPALDFLLESDVYKQRGNVGARELCVRHACTAWVWVWVRLRDCSITVVA